MIRAIICDDETASLNIVRYLIENEGLPIEIVGTATNGRKTLELLLTEKPDLAFLDIEMPGLNGFDVVKKLEDLKTKIIFITAYNTFAYAQEALRLGATDIIAKPINVSQLRNAISRAVGWNFTDSEPLNKALYYIHLHYAEAVTLSDLAAAACCTSYHLSHLFRQHFDMSVLSYIHKVRITEASRLLRDNVSVQEAAYRTGYSSMNHFYKYFKLYQGMTPAAFKKALNLDDESQN